MKFEKCYQTTLKSCYALLRMKKNEHDFILVASECDEPCYAIDLNNQFKKIEVWPNVGGTMTLVNIPGTLDFLATQKFYPGFQAKECRIVKGTFNGMDWDISEVALFPYLHRFILLPKNSENLYFIGCSIANSKKFIEDWTDPGKIFIGNYNLERNELSELTEMNQKITKNHGFHYDEKTESIYISGQEGVFQLRLDQAQWQLRKLLDKETSEIANLDIDDDGLDEYLCIQGFHGDDLVLYDHDFEKIIWKYTSPTPFGHALWGGTMHGIPIFIFGNRQGKQNLILLEKECNKFIEHTIDEQVGSSNVVIFVKNESYYIGSSNNEINEFALYKIDIGGRNNEES